MFSQWEMLLYLAAEVVRRYDPNFAMLHGGMPGPQRRQLLEKFRDDSSCRVFLSTDAGGTGPYANGLVTSSTDAPASASADASARS